MSAWSLTTEPPAQAYRSIFNSDWYLEHYPDVKAAGLDAWQHFSVHGLAEQRLPCPINALFLEEQLWQGDTQVLAPLHKEAEHNSLQGAVAAWVLARWYTAEHQFALAEPFIKHFFSEPLAQLIIRHAGPYLLQFCILYQQEKYTEADAWLANPHWPKVADKKLAELMLIMCLPQQAAQPLTQLNAVFQKHGLGLVALQQAERGLSFDNLTVDQVPLAKRSRWWQPQPLVSVIIPCYNAESTIETALRSLQQQSWNNLEILVVDDASTDHSVAVVARLVAQDSRIRLLPQTNNQGAYAARNKALAQAKGKFITVHDSDDWSHPQKIEYQVNALLASRQSVACVSHWVRCTPEFNFTPWRQEANWIYRNVSSLMMKRTVVRKLGFWDKVAVNADTEYYYRIVKRFGATAISEVLPGIPLAFGRLDAQSLTQQSHTHLRTQHLNGGLRRRYHQAALQWHANASTRQLYLPQFPNCRPFAAPALMCRGTVKQTAHNLALLAEQSGLFNADWYRQRYPDVAAAGMDPWLHYLHYGYKEHRDPCAHFSSSGYQWATPEAQQHNPLLHLLQAERAVDYVLPLHQGQLTWQQGKPALLLCAHQVTTQCYGAERSLLDVLQALAALPYNLVVTLPSAMNSEYVAQIADFCHRFMILPYAWWRTNRSAEPATVQYFVDLMQRCNIQLVYCNTLTLLEPLIAAKQANIPSVTHVRELPEYDIPLCEVLQCEPMAIRQQLLERSDFFIANSKVVANYLNATHRTTVISNVIAAYKFDLPFPAHSRVQLGMISSNLPKKGLADFVKLAALLQQQSLAVDCLLIGPENEHTQALLADPNCPANLRVMGYMHSAQAAISQLDIVVNLSHFQESFGRTVLEAMAASRPVVCYDWGALPELVVHEQTGFLAPLGNITQIAEYVTLLVKDEALCTNMGQAGQKRAQTCYSPFAMQQAFASWLPVHTGNTK